MGKREVAVEENCGGGRRAGEGEGGSAVLETRWRHIVAESRGGCQPWKREEGPPWRRERGGGGHCDLWCWP